MTPDELRALADELEFNDTMDAIDLQLQQQIAQGNLDAMRRDMAQGTTYRTRQIMDFERRMRQAEMDGFNRVWGQK